MRGAPRSKVVGGLADIKETWRDKVLEILRAEAKEKFHQYPVQVSVHDVRFLKVFGDMYVAVSMSVSNKFSVHLFSFEFGNRNEKYLKSCAEQMLKGIPKMLLDFAKTIIKLNEKAEKVEEPAA